MLTHDGRLGTPMFLETGTRTSDRCSATTCLCDGFLADIFDPPTWDGCPHQITTGLGRRPFPTGRETEILEKAYNSAPTRGRPTQVTIAALMCHTRAGTKEIRAWFAIARRARSHSTPSDTQFKEAPASLEVSMRHPTSSSGTNPTFAYVFPREEENTEPREYCEEEFEANVNPSCTEAPTGGAPRAPVPETRRGTQATSLPRERIIKPNPPVPTDSADDKVRVPSVVKPLRVHWPWNMEPRILGQA